MSTSTFVTLLLTTLNAASPHDEIKWQRPWPGDFPSTLEFLDLSNRHSLRVHRDTSGVKGRCVLKNLRHVNRNLGWHEDMVIDVYPTFYIPPNQKLEPYQIAYLAELAQILDNTGWKQVEKNSSSKTPPQLQSMAAE